MSKNAELAELFSKFAAMMDLKGESAFKSIAFSKISRLLKDASFDVAALHAAGTLKDVEGIGPSSLRIIDEYLRTGQSTDFTEVAAGIPPGLIPMLEIPGLGPKTVRLFWIERGIESIEALEKAIADGSLDGLKGVGKKKIEAIQQGIELKKASAGRLGIAEAEAAAMPLLEQLRGLRQVKEAAIAGSLRRGKETIGDVDLVCCVEREADAETITGEFVKFAGVNRVLGQGVTKASVLTDSGLQVDCRVVPAENYGAALLYFTGSKDHNVRIRGLAQDKGLTLNEWGLYKESAYAKAKKETGRPPELKPVASGTEREIYEALGLEWIPPEMREDRGETGLKKMPRLIEEGDLRGDLHTHTTASDGANTIEEMAEAAKAMGYEYLAITDHSKSQVIANGLDAKRLLKHVEAIHKAGAKIKGITLLAGCEVDILADGSMDFPDEVLKELDWVVGSPHVALGQDEEKATARILRAIENRYVNVIGHPTGRLINARHGLPLDFGKVIAAAKASGTALEINAGYPRLDLSEGPARMAHEAGVMLTIDTDAHSTAGLAERRFGVGVARRAWVTPGNVLNCQTLAKVRAFVRGKR
jgi:DNA polymerase (family 10)